MSARSPSGKAAARIEAQRERILNAAQECFIGSGFHAASMASIAETAGMSAGLIYRYFENKNAIILAIVERQLQLLRDDIQLNRKIDLPREMTDSYGRSSSTDSRSMNASLLLEISAEATRDSQIAAALDTYDSTLRTALVDWLMRSRETGGHALPASIAPMRALILQCLFEGLKLRETREPNLDRDLLGRALRAFVPLLLAP